MYDQSEVGERLRLSREEKKMTRDDFSEAVDLSVQFYSEVEKGKKGLSVESLYRICEIHDISADYILFGEKNRETRETPLEVKLHEAPSEYRIIAEKMAINFLDDMKKNVHRTV
ncbi:MAG: helix-turn-helix domain-containing protein [Lachnospiraceae bacterium]|nr:helix-turn-helix domain-containing protein [Lachnospiraceae bacterium]